MILFLYKVTHVGDCPQYVSFLYLKKNGKVLINHKKCDIIIPPNKFNKSGTGYFYTLFCHTMLMGLIKMQIPLSMVWFSSVLFKFVWRQSEFAFFMRQLRLAHFLIYGGKFYGNNKLDRQIS